jgi:hypothetical protein
MTEFKTGPIIINDEGTNRAVEPVVLIGAGGGQPRVTNGGLDINIQDQHTTLIDSYFLQSVSNFTISADITASTLTTLEYDFEATAGHGLAGGNEIILLDTSADRAFYATVMNVATNTITLDRPIDYAFAASTTLGRIATSQMAVDGSSTEQIFTVRAGTVPFDITRVIIQMVHSAAGDDGKFGGITAISRGLVMRSIDGVQNTIFNFKTNGDIRNFCFDLTYSDKAAGGENGTGARITFGGQSKHGVTIRLSGTDSLQWVVQDNLTGLTSLRIVAQGHEVE